MNDERQKLTISKMGDLIVFTSDNQSVVFPCELYNVNPDEAFEMLRKAFEEVKK